MRSGIVLTLLSALVIAAGCGGSDEAAGSGRRVVAAFYPLAYAVERVAPGAQVENLTPPGAEPHNLELSARQVERVEAADVVLYLGRGFMPALDDAVNGRSNAVDLLAGQTLLKGPEDGEGDALDFDPHVWLDPTRFSTMARTVAAALEEPDGANALVAELEKLDREYRRELAQCERRELVTSHAAFGYLAEAYGLEQVPLTGLSPETEPSAKAIERLVAEVKEGGATTVFFETLVSPRLAQTVAREAGAKAAVLNPLEGLTKEELDTGADYFSVMRENLAALRTALGCR
jgi:zinc transport system substrate-binding protein